MTRTRLPAVMEVDFVGRQVVKNEVYVWSTHPSKESFRSSSVVLDRLVSGDRVLAIEYVDPKSPYSPVLVLTPRGIIGEMSYIWIKKVVDK